MSQTSSRLATLLTVLPVLTAGLYATGQSHRQGYLSEYGLEDVLFVDSAERVLMSGFVALMNLGGKPLMYSFFAAMSLVIVTCIVAMLMSSDRGQNIKTLLLKRVQNWRAKKPMDQQSLALVDGSTRIYTYATVALLAFLLVLVQLLAAWQSGVEQAKAEKVAFMENKGVSWTLQSSALGTSIRARPIACGTSHCAFWTGQSAVVVRSDQLDRITALSRVPAGKR